MNYMIIVYRQNLSYLSKTLRKKISKIFPKKKYYGPVFKRHPLEDIPAQSLLDSFIRDGNESLKNFPVAYRTLEETVKKFNPTVAMGIIGFYSSLTAIKNDGSTKNINSKIRQDHAEILQALFIKNSTSRNKPVPSPNDVQSLFDQAKELANLYSRQKAASFTLLKDKKLRSEAYILDHLQLHTQIVRNWAHYYQAMNTAKNLLSKIDKPIEHEIGLSATQILDLLAVFTEQINEKVNGHFKCLGKLFSCSTSDELLDIFSREDDLPESLIKRIKEDRIELPNLKHFLVALMDLRLYKNYQIDVDSVATELKIDGTILSNVLSQMSMEYGSCDIKLFEDIFIANPIWQKPFIKLSEKSFFLPLPNLLPAYIFRIFESLMSKSPQLLDRYLKKTRAQFLENEVKACFERSFPGAKVILGYKWHGYESDLLVEIDNNLFIVEAKAHKANPASLRGGVKSARTFVERAFWGPSIQSLRLQKQVEQAQQSPADIDTLLPEFPLNIDRIQNIYRLSVTLDDFAVLQTQLDLLQAAEWIPRDHQIAPCILLTDLEVIFEMLPLKALRIHYLTSRTNLNNHFGFSGDEMDLLGLYLQAGFNLGTPDKKVQLQITGMSKVIDDYYMTKSTINATKPKVHLHPYWLDLCKRIEERNFEEWTTAANVILNFKFDDQYDFMDRIRAIKGEVERNWKDPDHKCAAIMTSSADTKEALVFYFFKENHASQRHQKIQTIANQVFSEQISTVVVIAVNIDNNDYPYTTLAILYS
ncbi:hypothetical protein [Bdellovibrio bacteriovorus]|uniref:hypothetical protein n=1 Tax=Bdellovibrio bacteriovorus TaxID=959 RepID=UPI003CFCC3B6